MSGDQRPASVLRPVGSPHVAEPPAGTFSQAMLAGDFLFVSGQHAGAHEGPVGGADMEAQAREAFRRVLALVEAAGARPEQVVKLTVYVTDMTRRAEVSAARREFFSDPMPCSTLVGVSALADPGLLVEVEAVAFVPQPQGLGS
jgi:enamine deaminase RidA (YjgF/YER057c/UK114 family)